jgi:ferritin-like protein
MPSGSTTLHEPDMPADLVDRHRAIVSIMEELEAVDWYDQRAAATSDPTLAGVLAHNRDEEKEHAAMTLEWLRRRDPKLDEMLRTYLFTTGSILEVEAEAEGRTEADGGGGGGGGNLSPGGSLGIGSLKLTDDALGAGGLR